MAKTSKGYGSDERAMKRYARGLAAEEARTLASPEHAAAVEQSKREVAAMKAARVGSSNSDGVSWPVPDHHDINGNK